jgi:hypothetical protein
MFSSVVHKGDRVLSPSGRQWNVIGWNGEHTHLELIDDAGERCTLKPSLLVYISGSSSSDPIDLLAPVEVAHVIENSPKQ